MLGVGDSSQQQYGLNYSNWKADMIRKSIVSKHVVPVDMLQLALDMETEPQTSAPTVASTLFPTVLPTHLPSQQPTKEYVVDPFAVGKFDELRNSNPILKDIWANQFPQDCKSRKAWVIRNFQLTGN